MAVFTPDELTVLRNAMARNSTNITWTKAQVNAALQAIEDRMRAAGTQTALSNDIEAVAPGVFGGAEKTRLFGIWCVTAAKRLGIIS